MAVVVAQIALLVVMVARVLAAQTAQTLNFQTHLLAITAAHTEAVAVVEARHVADVILGVAEMAALARCELFTPAILVASHQLVQETCNA